MTNDDFRVDLPGGGGGIHLQSREEVDRWTTLDTAYREQYDLRKINDLTNLGTLLVQHVNLYRAQQALSGRLPEVDEDDLPTGRYTQRVLKPAEVRAHQEQITNASKEIREIEKTMMIDKKSREAGGEETNRQWLARMKARAHRYGLHVSRRVTEYEKFVMELRWRVHLNAVGDAEDKHYESVSDADIVAWARIQLAELERIDQEFAKEEGALVVGQL